MNFGNSWFIDTASNSALPAAAYLLCAGPFSVNAPNLVPNPVAPSVE